MGFWESFCGGPVCDNCGCMVADLGLESPF